MRLKAGWSGSRPFFSIEASVHAGGKIVAVLLFQRTLGVFGGGIQLLPQQIAVALAQQRERPRPAHLVGGNGVAPSPSCRRRTGRNPCRDRRSCRWPTRSKLLMARGGVGLEGSVAAGACAKTIPPASSTIEAKRIQFMACPLGNRVNRPGLPALQAPVEGGQDRVCSSQISAGCVA